MIHHGGTIDRAAFRVKAGIGDPGLLGEVVRPPPGYPAITDELIVGAIESAARSPWIGSVLARLGLSRDEHLPVAKQETALRLHRRRWSIDPTRIDRLAGTALARCLIDV